MAIKKPLAGMMTPSAPSGYQALLTIDPSVLEAIPAAVYVCAADGVIVRFNSRAAELWGRSPRPGDTDERFCGSFRLYDLEGGYLPHARTPMATALRSGRPQHDKEVVIQRPDGSRIVASVHIDPLKDGDGHVEGAINCFQDITGRKRAEEGLRKSQSELDDFFENAVVAMHWVGGDGTVLRANRAELNLLGYTREEYVGRNIAEFHADRSKSERILASLSAGETLEKVPAQLRAKDGSTRHVLINSSAHFRKGEVVNTRCVTLDVTAEKHAELITRDSELRSRALLDALPAAVYTADPTGRITYYNQAAVELWGSRPEPDGARWCGSRKLSWPDGTPLPHDECPMALALKEKRPVSGMEIVAERPDGTRVPFIPFATPLYGTSGQVVGAVNMLLDITNRKRAEHARLQLISIIESSDDAITSIDLNGTIDSWNRGAERLFGYSAGEVLGESITMLIPPSRQNEEKRILERIRCGERFEHYDTVRRRKDGSLLDISLTVSPLKNAEGSIVGASKIARDITERRRAEKALARRMDEQAALYRFTDRLHRGKSLGDVYDSALDTILRALPCQRAAILLFDGSGAMRFAASRGLSDEYRRATDGHSPWTADAEDPQPICIDDIEGADIAAPLRAAIRAEGVGALAFIPLVANGKVVGKFMSYYDAPHHFTDSEVELAVTIARQLVFGVERVRADEARRIAEEALRESEARERARAAELQTIMESVPAVIWIARDPEGRVIDGNRFSHEFLRLPRDVNQSLSAPEGERPRNFRVLVDGRALAPEDLPVQRAARGEEVRDFEEETRFEDGESRHLLGNATPLRDAEGNPCGAVAAFVDITDRKKAEEERDLLVAELSHRVKNTLATVISIAGQSFSKNRSVDEAHSSFTSRIRALAQTHSRLAEAKWAGASLEALLLDEFAPYGREDGSNLRISGPPVILSPKCALTLGMSIHELTTNAAKYGALSTESGSVDVTWQVDSQHGQLRILWTETGGPMVSPPGSSGFGRLLLERALASDVGGDVQLNFAEDGLTCAIAIPLEGQVALSA